jgi:hypothetical protein
MLNLDVTASLETSTGFTLDTDQLDTGQLGYLFTSIGAKVRSASWGRGRNSFFDGFSAGSATVVFDNNDRRLDPVNTSSPLYGELYPGRQFSLFLTQATSTATVFSGYVDTWEYNYTLEGDATVTVRVIDAFSYLQNVIISSISAPEESSGARVRRVLANIGWPVSRQAVENGYSTLAAENIAGVSVLEYLSKVAQSEFGQFYIDRLGTLTFKARNAVGVFSDVRVTNVVGDVNSTSSDVMFDYSFDRMFNEVTLTNDAIPATATAANSASVTKYGERPNSFDVLIASSTEMQSIARGIVTLYGEPAFIPRQVTVNVENFNLFVPNDSLIQDRDKPILNFRTIDIGYLTSAYWLPPGTVGGTDPISIPALLISGVKYDATPGLFTATLQLDYALGYNSFILDDPIQGRLDTGILGV